MKYTSSLFFAAFVLGAALASAQSSTPLALPTGGRPPARINDASPASAPAVSPALRQQANAALENWKTAESGAAFAPGLTYVNGKPALMLVTSSTEPAATKLNRKRAIVTACDFLLDAGAFDEATICVVTSEKNGKSPAAAKNYRVKRAQFEQAATQAGKSANAKDAVKKARNDDALVGDICAALGIE